MAALFCLPPYLPNITERSDMFAYLRSLFKDPLLLRVCMYLWGLPLALLGGYALAAWHPAEAMEWVGVALLALVGLLGLYLLAAAAMGSDADVRKAMEFMHEGGEPVGFVLAVLVMLMAIMVTAVFRVVRRY